MGKVNKFYCCRDCLLHKWDPVHLSSLFRFTILLILLAACQAPVPTALISPTPGASPRVTRTPTPAFTGTPAPPSAIPSPTADPGVITPKNADRLVQLKQLGMGWLTGSPLYAPDGRWLLLPTNTGVMIYETASYQDGRLLTPGSGGFTNMAISPDGKILAIGSKLIAIDDGHELSRLEIPPGFEDGNSVREAKFSPDGRLLALAYYGDDQLGVWRLEDGRLLYDLKADSLDFSADGRQIVTSIYSDANPHIQLYDTYTGGLLREWPGGKRAVLLPGNRLALEAGGAVRVFELSTGKVPIALNGRYAAFSPDGRMVALLLYDQLWIYRLSDGQLLSKPEGDFQDADQVSLRFAPDGQTLTSLAVWTYCCGGSNSKLSLWRVADGTLIRKSNGGVFAFAPDSRSLAHGVEIWDTSDGSTFATLEGFSASPVSGLAFSPDGEQLIALSGHDLLFFQVSREQLARLQPANLDLPADRLVGIPDRKIERPGRDFWRAVDGAAIDPLSSRMIKSMPYDHIGATFSPDGRWVAVGDGDKLQLWNIEEQTLVLEQKVCTEMPISSLDFSPDSQQLALGMKDGSVELWSVNSDQKLIVLPNIDYYPVSALAFSSDSKLLATGRGDGSVRLWGIQ